MNFLIVLLLMGKVSFSLTSPAFKTGTEVPVKYACEGENISPELMIGEVPKGTKSLALIVDDPDGNQGIITHWVVWNIPADTKVIREGARIGITGQNQKGENKYMGPCPASGQHHYYFKMYALEKVLDLKEGATKSELINAINGHIKAEGELIGLYAKQTTGK